MMHMTIITGNISRVTGHLAWEANTEGYFKIDAKTQERVKLFFSAEELVRL